MEKPKVRKPKIIQMKYPAPYSQSWTSPQTEKKADKGKKKIKKNTTLLQTNLYSSCCRSNRPTPNPYAPHLKYGIFPQQAAKTRSQLTTFNVKPSIRNSMNHGTVSEHVHSKLENKKHRKGQLCDAPLLVIRPIDKRHRRHLSVSETLHLDIKPRRYMPISPIRKSSAIFQNVVPKMNSNIE